MFELFEYLYPEEEPLQLPDLNKPFCVKEVREGVEGRILNSKKNT